MPDPRNFAKVDLGYFDNPKITSLLDDRPRVALLHLRAILYCRQHLTDGKFPVKAVVRMASATVCQDYWSNQCSDQCDFCSAVSAGLFERLDARSALVHDYLEHQESAKMAADRKAAGQKGAEVRWSKKRDGKTDSPTSGPAIGGTNAPTNAEKRREEKSSTASRKQPSTAIPDNWQPSDAHGKYASEHHLDISSEAFRFRNHALTNDRRVVRWDAAFSNWLAKADPPRHLTANRGSQPEGW